ncbi:MAG: hypothetical protein EXR57_00675 [Dehalococcoidia bacterium]|nr:hypothetical protein [Dehalococcoidia bacterium]MSQ34319.1 hypothetical protein [Dehalococcoidia bacterium]
MAQAEPAWFYSSVAQSASTIVGLLGALQITRLADHATRLRRDRSSLDSQLVKVMEAYRRRTGHWQDLEDFWAAELALGQQATERREITRRPTATLDWANPRSRGARAGKPGEQAGESGIVELDSALRQKLSVLGSVREVYEPLPQRVSVEWFLSFSERALFLAETVEPQLAEALKTDAASFDQISAAIQRLQADLVSRATFVLVSLLTFFTIVCIIVPTAWLWWNTDPIEKTRGIWLLSTFAAALSFMNGYFWFQISEIQRYGRVRWPSGPGLS